MSFELFINICNASFEFYNVNNLNENIIGTTYMGVDNFIIELNVKTVNETFETKIACYYMEKSYKTMN